MRFSIFFLAFAALFFFPLQITIYCLSRVCYRSHQVVYVHRYLLLFDTVSGGGQGQRCEGREEEEMNNIISRPAQSVSKKLENNTYRERDM